MNLILYFGGKKSPLKLSTYTLKFGGRSISKENPIELIENIQENILVSTNQKNLGANRESLLKYLLKR